MFVENQSFASACKSAMAAEPSILRNPTKDRVQSRLEHFGALYGSCPPMKQLFRTLERLSATAAPVMILGESGSGKELVATTIHHLSARRQRPFIAVNCGALPETLIESELFGHERGSFTGAARTHRGCFERASGGTLFLDEVTEMPIDMQVRLLRVLETGRFCRIGGDQEIVTDVRVLAASNRDLGQAVAEGRLREDLMYRLCVIPVTVPPLRERGEDVPLLADMFLQELNDEQGCDKTFSAAARELLADYPWPGNVRELKNVVHRAFVLSDDEVNVDVGGSARLLAAAAGEVISLPAQSGTRGSSNDITIQIGMSLEEAERALIMATLKAVENSKARAAEVLGISLKTLYNRLHAYRGSGPGGGKAGLEDDCAELAA
jgi:DNA-binding NtrC family response regulator